MKFYTRERYILSECGQVLKFQRELVPQLQLFFSLIINPPNRIWIFRSVKLSARRTRLSSSPSPNSTEPVMANESMEKWVSSKLTWKDIWDTPSIGKQTPNDGGFGTRRSFIVLKRIYKFGRLMTNIHIIFI